MLQLVRGLTTKIEIKPSTTDEFSTNSSRPTRTPRPAHERTAPKTRISIDTESPTAPRSASPASASKQNLATNLEVRTASTDSSEYVPLQAKETLIETLHKAADVKSKIKTLNRLAASSNTEHAALTLVKHQTPEMVAEVYSQLPPGPQKDALKPYIDAQAICKGKSEGEIVAHIDTLSSDAEVVYFRPIIAQRLATKNLPAQLMNYHQVNTASPNHDFLHPYIKAQNKPPTGLTGRRYINEEYNKLSDGEKGAAAAKWAEAFASFTIPVQMQAALDSPELSELQKMALKPYIDVDYYASRYDFAELHSHVSRLPEQYQAEFTDALFEKLQKMPINEQMKYAAGMPDPQTGKRGFLPVLENKLTEHFQAIFKGIIEGSGEKMRDFLKSCDTTGVKAFSKYLKEEMTLDDFEVIAAKVPKELQAPFVKDLIFKLQLEDSKITNYLTSKDVNKDLQDAISKKMLFVSKNKKGEPISKIGQEKLLSIAENRDARLPVRVNALKALQELGVQINSVEILGARAVLFIEDRKKHEKHRPGGRERYISAQHSLRKLGNVVSTELKDGPQTPFQEVTVVNQRVKKTLAPSTIYPNKQTNKPFRLRLKSIFNLFKKDRKFTNLSTENP